MKLEALISKDARKALRNFALDIEAVRLVPMARKSRTVRAGKSIKQSCPAAQAQ